MDKQPIGSSSSANPTQLSSPSWWTDQHSSTWERVKEALRRDWEQTRSDFSASDAVDLNQNVGDTVMQAAGTAPIPSPMVQTRRDDPRDEAKRAEKVIKERGRAQTDIAVEQARAQGEVASEVQTAQEKIVDEQRKLAAIAASAREKAAKNDAEAREKLAKQQQKITAVSEEASGSIADVQRKAAEKIVNVQRKAAENVAEVRDWSNVEPAVRYGYGARLQHTDLAGWDDNVDARLQQEWARMHGPGTWVQVRPSVRRGWDAASRTTGW